MTGQESSGSNDDNKRDAQNSSAFPPLIRQNSSIKRCYGSPSIRQAKLELHSNQQKHAAGRSIPPALCWTTNAAALLSAFLFSGIIFGWAPLKLVLIHEGQYAELCRSDSSSSSPPPQQQQATTPCVAQMNQFNVIFTLAQFFLSFASLPVGFFLDYAPKAFHYGVATVFQVGGLLLFGISSSSSSSSRDYFVLAYSCLALGGCMTILGAFPASFLLPKHQAGILAGISCLFDASSIIFAIFYRLNLVNDYLFSRKHLFVSYAMLGLLVYGLLSYCWGALERLDWKNIIEEEGQQESHSDNDDDDELNENQGGEADPHLVRIRRLGMHERSLLQQLGTFDFVLVLTFASVHMLRCNFYIETVNEILASMGDDDATYANIFSFVLPAGVVFVPLIEATVRQLGVVGTLHVTNALGVLFGALLLIPSLYLQVINFAIFACFRAYLYATLSTFIAITFGVSTMGRVIGFTFTSAAIVTLLQYPAAAMAEGRHNNDFTIVNLIMLLASTVPIGLAYVYVRSTQQQSSKVLNGEGQPLLSDRNAA